jgi:hypothetical protein
MGFEIWKSKNKKIPASSGNISQNDLRRATPMSKTSLNSNISNITLDEIKRSSKQRWQDANRKSQLMRSTSKQWQRVSKEKKRTPSELRQIRDSYARSVRKTSVMPQEEFIIEEGMLEDLCEIAGEEAAKGGGILSSNEKDELICRLSKNRNTECVFKSAKNLRKFSTASMKGNTIALDVTGNIVTLDDRSNEFINSKRTSALSVVGDGETRRSSATSKRPSVLSRLSERRKSSIIRQNPRGSSLVAPIDHGPGLGRLSPTSIDRRLSILSANSSNEDQVKRLSGTKSIMSTKSTEQDGLKLRRKSLQVSNLSKMPNEVHGLTTHVNYRTEVQALKYAQGNERCSCCKSFLTTFNIYL